MTSRGNPPLTRRATSESLVRSPPANSRCPGDSPLQSTLGEFRETETGQAFTKQNGKLLKVELSEITIQAKLGSMVAYQGDVRFEHAGSGGMQRMIKKAVTGEGTKLMKISGTGE